MHADRTISTAEGTLPDRRGTAVSDSGQTWAAWAAHGWRWAVVHGQHLGPEWGFAEAVTNASIFWTMYSGSTGTSGSSSPVRICKGAAEHARHWNGCSCRCAQSRTTHLEPILEFIESDCIKHEFVLSAVNLAEWMYVIPAADSQHLPVPSPSSSIAAKSRSRSNGGSNAICPSCVETVNLLTLQFDRHMPWERREGASK